MSERKIRKRIEQLRDNIGDETANLLLQANELIYTTKLIDKMAFKLAFIIVNNGVNSDKALQLLQEMVNRGLITEQQVERIMNKVKRYVERL